MNFQDFKIEIENNLRNKIEFELIEFHYLGYAFGNGHLVYSIKGRVYAVIYDGKENNLIIERGKPHDKYPGGQREIILSQQGLDIHKTLTILTSSVDT